MTYKILQRYAKQTGEANLSSGQVERFLDWLFEQGYEIDDYRVKSYDFAYKNKLVIFEDSGYYIFNNDENVWRKSKSLDELNKAATKNGKNVEWLSKSMLEKLED